MLGQTAEVSKGKNPGAVSIRPTGLQRITAYEIEADKFEAFVVIAHMRTHDLTEHIWLVTASGARARVPQQFEFQKRFRAVILGNRQFVSDLLNIRRLEAHDIESSSKERRLSSHGGRSRDRPSLLAVRRKSPCPRAPGLRLP